MTEAQFQAWVVDVATIYGWKCWHVPAPMVNRKGTWVGAKQGAGLPDLILIHDDPPRLIFAEVKKQGGKLSERQQEFLKAARGVARAAVDGDELDYVNGDPDVLAGPSLIGVYVLWPGMEEAIVAMLKTRELPHE